MTQVDSPAVDASLPSDRAPAVLFVDLDGTLVATDLFLESLLIACKHDPWTCCRLPGWYAAGRARLKAEIAQRGVPAARNLPFRPEVLEFLAAEKAAGKRIVLATAADRAVAERVAAELDLIDDWIASDGTHNLKGAAKLAAIEAYCHEHGYSSFGYIGDSHVDLPIWKAAREVYVVGPSRGLAARLARECPPQATIAVGQPIALAVFKALRPRQWAKNLLLFVPLLLAHAWSDPTKWLASLVAFIAMSACASAVYVANDLLDIEADRAHPSKRRRPFAAGTLPVRYGPPLILGLLTLAFGLAIALTPWGFAGILFVYLALTTCYSWKLKQVPILDVMLLAGLYTLRILAGGLATTTVVSEWLMAFAIFMFTSLAFAKRYSELSRLAFEGNESAAGRGYRTTDLAAIGSMGPTAGYLAVLVLALYINSDVVRKLYLNIHLLWFICLVVLYWISRLWLLAHRRLLSEDPVVFALTDRVSLSVGAFTLLLLLAAAWGW